MRYIKWPVTGVTFILIFALLQGLLVPKYTRDGYEAAVGALVREYYAEVKDHSVLIIGDCEVYSNISPITLWSAYGITSYIRGSAQQLIWHSYYLLEDALRYEKPDVVIFSVFSMQYNEPQREEYNRMAIDDMRLSASKIKSVRASVMEHENPLSYLFPILRYNDRWSALTFDDLRYFFNKPPVSVNGFTIRSDVKPAGFIPTGNPLPTYRFADVCYEYLDKMTALCKDNDIQLILIKAPIQYPYWYAQWDEQMVEYAKKNGLTYLNLIDRIDDTGLDFETDTFNAGLHLNVYGAEKLALYLGRILQDEYNVKDRRSEVETAVRWEDKTKTYHAVIERQLMELEIDGRIVNYLIK